MEAVECSELATGVMRRPQPATRTSPAGESERSSPEKEAPFSGAIEVPSLCGRVGQSTSSSAVDLAAKLSLVAGAALLEQPALRREQSSDLTSASVVPGQETA